MPIAIPVAPYIWPQNATLRDQQKIAQAFCVQNLSGQTFQNLASGDSILVQGGGIKHSIYGAHHALLRAMSVLPLAISQAVPLGKFPDKLGRPDILSARKYEVDFDDAGQLLIGQIVVREHQGSNKTTYLQFYDLAFIKR